MMMRQTIGGVDNVNSGQQVNRCRPNYHAGVEMEVLPNPCSQPSPGGSERALFDLAGSEPWIRSPSAMRLRAHPHGGHHRHHHAGHEVAPSTRRRPRSPCLQGNRCKCNGRTTDAAGWKWTLWPAPACGQGKQTHGAGTGQALPLPLPCPPLGVLTTIQSGLGTWEQEPRRSGH